MKKNSILLIFIGIFIIIPTYAQTYTDAIDSIFSHISRTDTSATYWPDYVFENDYNLMTLRELEQYVTANKHLPGIPSAAEVEKKGDVDLGAMNALLLEKVEELTRYVIDLQNQIDELKNGKE
jgi:hypothetical protein